MLTDTVSKRYARGLFELASEKDAIGQVKSDLIALDKAFKDVPEFETFLEHPQIGSNDKKETIHNVFQGKISEYVLNLMSLLIDRKRESAFSGIVDAYIKYANEACGIENATVYSAIPLDEAELGVIAEQFGKKIGKQLNLTNIVDKSVIGGLVIQIGDLVYDGSIRNKLARFKQSITK